MEASASITVPRIAEPWSACRNNWSIHQSWCCKPRSLQNRSGIFNKILEGIPGNINKSFLSYYNIIYLSHSNSPLNSTSSKFTRWKRTGQDSCTVPKIHFQAANSGEGKWRRLQSHESCRWNKRRGLHLPLEQQSKNRNTQKFLFSENTLRQFTRLNSSCWPKNTSTF